MGRATCAQVAAAATACLAAPRRHSQCRVPACRHWWWLQQARGPCLHKANETLGLHALVVAEEVNGQQKGGRPCGSECKPRKPRRGDTRKGTPSGQPHTLASLRICQGCAAACWYLHTQCGPIHHWHQPYLAASRHTLLTCTCAPMLTHRHRLSQHTCMQPRRHRDPQSPTPMDPKLDRGFQPAYTHDAQSAKSRHAVRGAPARQRA